MIMPFIVVIIACSYMDKLDITWCQFYKAIDD
jgi:hypothetical protein